MAANKYKEAVCLRIRVRAGYYMLSEGGREREDRSRLWFITLVYKQLDWCDLRPHGQLPCHPQEEGEAAGVGLNFYLRWQLPESLTVKPHYYGSPSDNQEHCSGATGSLG